MEKFDTSLHVLVAEDNRDDAFLLQAAFKKNGILRPAHIVPDGAEAIAYLKGEGVYSDRVAHPYPGIIVLDLKMPRMNGFDVLAWLQREPSYKVIPTIIWSASADLRDVKHAYCLGANGYLCKPTEFEDFTVMVKHLLQFWSDCLRPGVEPHTPNCEQLADKNPMMGSHH